MYKKNINQSKIKYTYIKSNIQWLNKKLNYCKFQRPLNSDRILELSNNFKNNYIKNGDLGLRLPLCLAKYLGKYYLLDGQHRYSAIIELIRNGVIHDMEIYICIINCNSESEIFTEFKNINNVTPIPSTYLMPSTLVDNTLNSLKSEYVNFKSYMRKGINKVTSYCRRPQIDSDSIKSILIRYKIVERFKISDSSQLVQYLQKLDDYYRSLSYNEICERTIDSKTPYKTYIKIIKNRNYSTLGFFKSNGDNSQVSWVNDLFWIIKNIQNKDYPDLIRFD